MSQWRQATRHPILGLSLLLAVIAIVAQQRTIVRPEEDWLRCAVAHIQAEAERDGKPARLSAQKASLFDVRGGLGARKLECDPAELARYLKKGGDADSRKTWGPALVAQSNQKQKPTELEIRMSSLFHLESAGPEVAYFGWQREVGQGRAEMGIIELRIGTDGRPIVSSYYPIAVRWHCS